MLQAAIDLWAFCRRARSADRGSAHGAAALALFLALALAGCALYPPSDAVRVPGGIEEVEQRFAIEPLDPDSQAPLVSQTLEQLEKTDLLRHYRGTTYRLTEGNHLPPGWLLQTPNVWGMAAADVPFFPVDCQNCDPDFRLPTCVADPDCDHGTCAPLAASVGRPGRRARKFCLGHSDAVVDVFYHLVASAQHAVDITMLQPPADFRFLAALRNAITRLAYSGRPVTIRAIVGDFPPGGSDAEAFLRELVRDAGAAPHSRLRVYAGAMRSCSADARCAALSWNHSKIVAVDGKRAIVGGHNMWTPDYLAAAPVHDLSMQVEGPAAVDGHRFADALWDFLCDRPREALVNAWYSYAAGVPGIGDDCLSRMTIPNAGRNGSGGVPILAVGRLGAGIAPVFADQSLVARDLMLGAATRTIRMVQQDAAFAASALTAPLEQSWPDNVLDRFADLIVRKHGDVFLVLSNYGAAGPVGSYSNKVPLETVANKIRDVVQRRSGLAEPLLSALLCRHLHLAPLRFGPDATWPKDQPIGVHAKLWMVDDRAFYIGSENLYPVELQEFGYIVEDAAAAAQLRRDYWDQAWKWSRAAAISGDDAPSCIFERATAKRTR